VWLDNCASAARDRFQVAHIFADETNYVGMPWFFVLLESARVRSILQGAHKLGKSSTTENSLKTIPLLGQRQDGRNHAPTAFASNRVKFHVAELLEIESNLLVKRDPSRTASRVSFALQDFLDRRAKLTP